MARHKSAAKRARQAKKRQARNTAIETRVKGAVRTFRELLGGGDSSKAAAAMQAATRELQKAASKGVLHKRNAARRVGRLMKALSGSAAAAK